MSGTDVYVSEFENDQTTLTGFLKLKKKKLPLGDYKTVEKRKNTVAARREAKKRKDTPPPEGEAKDEAGALYEKYAEIEGRGSLPMTLTYDDFIDQTGLAAKYRKVRDTDVPQKTTILSASPGQKPLDTEEEQLSPEEIRENKQKRKGLGVIARQKYAANAVKVSVDNGEDVQPHRGRKQYKKEKKVPSMGFYTKKRYPIEVIASHLERGDEYVKVPDATTKIKNQKPTQQMGEVKQLNSGSGPEAEYPHIFNYRYFANPVYRFFLKLDMYPFLLGQSPDQAVNAKEEQGLNDYRRGVQRYVNSLLQVTQEKTHPQRKKNFANLVTNNQFKGSMNLIRQ